jgi:enamine deaminase RidA (YjgF/YER057c/UK114 family)
VVQHVKTEATFTLPGFSPAVVLPGGLVLVSGQVAIGLDGNIGGKGDFDAQVDLTLRNLREVLAAAGAKFEQVARLGIILSDRKYVGRWRELRSRYFREPYPASTLIVAGLVSEELLIEVEATACLGSRPM